MKTLAILALGVTLLAGQDLHFDVASVRLSAPANQSFWRLIGGPGSADPEHLRYSSVSMMILLATSFLIQADQIVGPEWVKTEEGPEHFDISANLPPNTTREQMSAMMLNLLKERFHFAWHVDKKDFDVYELVVAKDGSKLKVAEVPDEIPEAPSGSLSAADRGSDGFPVLPAGSTMGEGLNVNGNASMFLMLQRLTGFQIFVPSHMPGLGLTHFTLRNITIRQLIGFAQRYLESGHVVDHTGLTGTYDVKVAFEAGKRPVGAHTDEASEPAPDIFNAFEKQLGLKFQKTKAPLDVIVVDRIDKVPTDN